MRAVVFVHRGIAEEGRLGQLRFCIKVYGTRACCCANEIAQWTSERKKGGRCAKRR